VYCKFKPVKVFFSCKSGRDRLNLCGLVDSLLIDYTADVSATQASVQAVNTDGNKVACDVHTFPANGIKKEVRRLFVVEG
jgi:hypothetical protein